MESGRLIYELRTVCEDLETQSEELLDEDLPEILSIMNKLILALDKEVESRKGVQIDVTKIPEAWA